MVYTFRGPIAPPGRKAPANARVAWHGLSWSGIPSDYVEKDGLRFASGLAAAWHERGGDFEYMRGRIDRIDYDVHEP